MLECLILGDSIAQGVANHRTECVEYAHVGWNSQQFNRHYRTTNLDANTVIISLGTNDHRYINTYQQLSALRSRIDARRVIWIMPAAVNPASGANISGIQASVERLAKANGDAVLTIPRPMADRYHPTGAGYKNLADRTRR
jgi:lysophospholipase L1-like esterase